jgi:hypothetical protein
MLENARPRPAHSPGAASGGPKPGRGPSGRSEPRYLEAAGGVLLLALVHSVGVHLQGHLVVAASDLAV